MEAITLVGGRHAGKTFELVTFALERLALDERVQAVDPLYDSTRAH